MQPGSRWEVLGHRERQLFYGGLAGYRVFRIPVLMRAGRALLAFAEGRPTLRDHGAIDIVLRRSFDGGHSWDDVRPVMGSTALEGGTSFTVGNPVPIYVPREGALLLLFCSNDASATERAIRILIWESSRLFCFCDA